MHSPDDRSEGARPQFDRGIPSDDNRERLICRQCGWIHYENPRLVVGALATWDGRILLCKRAIAPREGYWTVPGGFMEVGETTEAGAVRETLEETGAPVAVDDLLAVYSLPHIGQVHLVYRGRVLEPRIDPGPESLEAAFFTADEIPWDELAFPTNTWALRHFLEARGRAPIAPFGVPLDAAPPHDPI